MGLEFGEGGEVGQFVVFRAEELEIQGLHGDRVIVTEAGWQAGMGATFGRGGGRTGCLGKRVVWGPLASQSEDLSGAVGVAQAQIQTAQVRAALSVNRELVLL